MTIKSLEELMQDEFYPCPLCGSPVGTKPSFTVDSSPLCTNCYEVDSRLPEFLEHENAREMTKDMIRRVEAKDANL